MKNTQLLSLLLFLLPVGNLQSQSLDDMPRPLITSAAQLNSPFGDYQEGTNIEYLIDNNTETFWHTDWHNQTAGDFHWVQVEFDEAVSGLMHFYMHRRNSSNDHPTQVEITASADGTEWLVIDTLDMPYGGFAGVTSSPFVVREPAHYIRITVTDCAGAGFRKFWHAAEIQLYHISDECNFSTNLTGVKINEVQVANIDQYIDHSYNYGAWIELYNPTDTLISCENARLRHCDAEGVVEETVLSLGQGLMRPHTFHTFWFDHNAADGTYGGQANLQIPFKLDPDGGTLVLMDAGGGVVDSIDYAPAIARCSYARQTDGGEVWAWTGEPTPDASNATSRFATERLGAPVIDCESTLFTEEISFNVEIPEGTTLRYTTDGSAPTARHGQTAQNGAFSVSETAIYRFVLVADGKLPSPVLTRSFIKDEHGMQLPVLSIATHPDNLFDDTIGVYVKGTNGVSGNGQHEACNWNMDWERPVNMELLVKEGDTYAMALNQEAEFSIVGGYSRAYGGGNGWEMKSSFQLKSGKLYEWKNSFDYPVFANSKAYNKYKTLRLRNGGNDTYARFKDPAIHEIFRSSGFYIDCQAWRPCHVFFNGRYLGMLNLRENNNKHYGDSGYGIDTDEMDQFEINYMVGYEQKEGDDVAFKRWLALTKELAANPTDAGVWEEICRLVDIDAYCNYMAAELYIGCNDWITNSNNMKGFRSRAANGKFHLVMFDKDSAFGSTDMIANMFTLLSNNDGRYADNNGVNYLAEIFYNMLFYVNFKGKFVIYFFIVGGSVMEPARCKKIIDDMVALTKDALAIEGNDPTGTASSLYSSISNESSRAARINNMKSFLNLDEGYNLVLESNIPEARLLLDGQEIPTRRFNGTVFAPAVITAKAPAGYRFREWRLVSDVVNLQEIFPYSSNWLFYDKGSLDGTDWKAPGYDASAWQSGAAPFGYGTVGIVAGAADYTTTIDYGGDASRKHPTYYFRTTFTLAEEPEAGEKFQLNYYLDDGAIFYVNGTEVGAYNCNSGLAFDDFSNAYEGNQAASGTIEIPAALLHSGSNTIAVEVHNTSHSSSDIFFEAMVARSPSATSVLSNSEELDLSELQENGRYALMAIYDKMEDVQTQLEQGASPIRINEISSGNSIYINDYFKKNDWIELYNTTDRDIDIAGMYLSDDRDNPQKYRIAADGSMASTIVPAYGKQIVWCDKLEPAGQLHAPFKLDNADGAFVSLMAEDGTWMDCVEYLAQDQWTTYGRYPDGGSHTSLLGRPTIALPNVMSTSVFAAENDGEWGGSDMAITLGLVEGWNWMSHNLAEDSHTSRFTAYSQSIVGKKDSLVKVAAGGWSGTLFGIKAAAGYKVKMNTTADVVLRGRLYDAQTSVALVEGWNWLGFPLYNATSLEVALANYVPTEGDAIIGLEAFATYEDGQWKGTLTSLSPGRAYMLKCGAAQSFCWNSLSPARSRVRRYSAPMAEDMAAVPWLADMHAYPNATGMIATLEMEGEEVTDGVALAAFCGEECRGVAEQLDGRFYMNIYGEGGESISFRLLDENGMEHLISQTLVLQDESVVGSRKAPFRLSTVSTGLQNAPTAGALRVLSTTYYHISGRKTDAPIPGLTIQKTIYENGTVVVKKIMK